MRNLEKLRAERQSYISRTGLAKMKLESRTKSGQLVLKADKVSKSFGEKCIIRNFSIQIRKGDRIGIVGPNGIGKSTLLKILLGEVIPDLGTAKLGSNLIVAKFDQMREQLNLENSLWQNLTDDPTMKASGKAGQMMVRGKSKHCLLYTSPSPRDKRQSRMPSSA